MKKPGVLLINLGSPDSPSVPDVRRYLREFLMDERVIDLAWPLRALLVYGCILPRRPRQSAEAYHKIWRPEGSPLVIAGKKIASALEARLNIPVQLAMRYQNPTPEQALRSLLAAGVEQLVIFPLFPHYAMSSYETAVERAKVAAAKIAPDLEVRVAPPYFEEKEYIAALVESARPILDQPLDHLLFSFHGIPERHLRKSDPTGRHCLSTAKCCETASPAHGTCYRAQCFKTARAFRQASGIPERKFSISFQSRLGRDPWLRPYTDLEIARLAREGVERLAVACPAFVADCLETLEEIGLRGRETFMSHGGKSFAMIPCLNDHPAWLDAMESLVGRQCPSLKTGEKSVSLSSAVL